MASTLKLKKSSVVGKVPLTTDLDYGELAINYSDGKLFYKKADNTIAEISGAGGGGGSSVLFDGTSSISTGTTATTKYFYILTASLTLTLPASPAVGDYVGVSNQSGGVACIIARNGQKIMNLAEDMTIDVVNAGFLLYYTGTTRGWALV